MKRIVLSALLLCAILFDAVYSHATGATAVGSMKGINNVSASGGFLYQIPLTLPPGLKTIFPSLSIEYNSQSTGGLLGRAWDISGLSTITRVPQTIHQDLNVAPVNFSTSDVFALDGQRLISTGANSYVTSVANFSTITSSGTSGTGPSSFTVETKDGIVYEYGTTTDSRMLAMGRSDVLEWALSKVYDKEGNYMTFSYFNDPATGQYRVTSINYSGNSVTSLTPPTEIDFDYTLRSDPNISWTAGSEIIDNTVITDIRILQSGTQVHKYHFDYILDVYSHLTKITEYGSSGGALPPTVINWGTAAPAYDLKTTSLVMSSSSSAYAIGDYNGDGVTDVMTFPKFASGGGSISFQSYLNNKSDDFTSSGSGTFTSDQTNVSGNYTPSNAIKMGFDYNGDGKDDQIILTYDNISSCKKMDMQVLISNGTSFNPPVTTNIYTYSTGSIPDFSKWRYTVGDFTGNGKKQLMLILPIGSGSGSSLAYSIHIFGDGITNPPLGLGSLNGEVNTLEAIDFDGDGKDDILTTTVASSSTCNVYSINTKYHSDGSPYFPSTTPPSPLTTLSSTGYPTEWHRIFYGDFNGDGKKDILTWSYYMSKGVWQIAYSTGTGWSVNDVTSSLGLQNVDPGDGSTSDGDNNYLIADFNGDGKDDILEMYWAPSINSYCFKVYYSQGNNAFNSELNTINNNDIPGNPILYQNLEVGDFNGDGAADILMHDELGANLMLLYFHKNEQRHLVHSILKSDNAVASSGRTFNITYQSLPQLSNYTPSSQTYPFTDYPLPIKVVTAFSDNVTTNNTYEYGGLTLHRTGLGLRGFAALTVHDMANNKSTISAFNTSGFETVVPSSVQHTNSATSSYTVYSQSSSTYAQLDLSAGSETYHIIYPTVESNTDYRSGTTSTTTTTYGTGSSSALVLYGQPDQTVVNISGGQEITTTQYTYSPSDPHYFNRCKPSQIVTTSQRSGKASYSRTTQFTYNGQGLIATSTKDPGTAHQNKHTLSYDSYGNVLIDQLQTASISTPITNNFNYSSDGRFMTKSADALGHLNTYVCNLWGSKTSVTDVNNLTTTFGYDEFNRLTTKTTPTGIVSTTTYSWAQGMPDAPPASLYPSYAASTQTTGVLGANTIYYDYYGEDIREVKYGFDGTKIYSDKSYFPDGSIASESLPYFVGGVVYNTTYTYDDWGRRITETHPTTTVNITYTPVTVSGIPSGMSTAVTNSTVYQTKTTEIDGTGAQTKVIETGTTLTYDYNSNGKPDNTQINGNPDLKTTYTYDNYGNQLSITTLNRGTTSYQYNSMDWLTSQTDAKGNTYTLNYDLDGRVTKRTGPDGIYTYTFDCGTGAIEKMCSSVSPYGTSINYSYDAYSRLASKSRTVAGETFTTDYTYDTHNRTSTLQYPTGDVVTYGYNSYGYFSAIGAGTTTLLSPGTILWQINSKNQYDETTEEIYEPFSGTVAPGHPIPPPLYTADNTFSPYGFLTGSTLVNNTSVSLNNYTYSFDPALGNLSSRTDNNRGLTEIFHYDNLNRLTQAEQLSSSGYSIATNNYSPEGNLIQKSDISPDTWAYNGYGVTTITNPTTVIPTFTQTTTYTPFNMVKSINENNNEIDFTYSADDMRAMAKYYNGGVLTKTRYYDDEYEKTVDAAGNTEEICYVYANDKPIAMFVHSSVANSTTLATGTYFLSTDYLGSITHIMDNAGYLVEERSYDSWGRYRNPSDWTYTGMPTYKLDRGYTGQEYLSDFNVINLNGRLYDPQMGRMFSPDPYVADNTNAQTFNCYSYANNNPLRYTDKNGKYFQVLIGAIVGGVVNLMVEAGRGHVNSWGDGFKAFGTGAVVGAVATVTFGAALGVATGAGVASGLATVGVGSAAPIAASSITLAATATASGISGGVSSALLTVGNGALLNDWDPKKSKEKQILENTILGTASGTILGVATWELSGLLPSNPKYVDIKPLETTGMKEMQVPAESENIGQVSVPETQAPPTDEPDNGLITDINEEGVRSRLINHGLSPKHIRAGILSLGEDASPESSVNTAVDIIKSQAKYLRYGTNRILVFQLKDGLIDEYSIDVMVDQAGKIIGSNFYPTFNKALNANLIYTFIRK